MGEEKRNSQRFDLEIQAKYVVKHVLGEAEYNCRIEDISEDGVGIEAEVEDGLNTKPKGGLKPGILVQLKINNLVLPCKVVYVETSRVGLSFASITSEQKEELKKIIIG